jgi:diketogulonate reductase-like aldo/keto reductase
VRRCSHDDGRRTNFEDGDHQPSARNSLDHLGVECVDLLMFHWPYP